MTRFAPLTCAFAALGAACALVPALAMWGFTVDDALIPVRYAHNLASGAGYRFDAGGASTDGVTPLPWALLLAPLAGAGPMTTLVRAKVLGIVVWTVGGAMLGARAGAMVSGATRVQVVLAASALVVMAVAFPIGAWAASGMETGLATALATVAVTRLTKPKQSAALAGLAAAFRPELVVWAMASSAGTAILARSQKSTKALAVLLAVAPFAACAAVRMVVFGRPSPLALLAKPSDLSHGLVYAAAAALVLLTPLLACAPATLVRAREQGSEVGTARVVALAFLAHAVAVVGAGGDWMPYARLMVPVAPSLVIAFVAVMLSSRAAWSAARLVVAGALGVLIAVRAAPAGRGVHPDRVDLVARARPVLQSAHVVAALDVGWVSAATDARIVDLAGLTDPAIAMLPGGHTSKRVDVSMLLDRGVDTVVIYSELRAVETRIVWSELFASRFEEAEKLPLGSRGAFYTVYRLRPKL